MTASEQAFGDRSERPLGATGCYGPCFFDVRFSMPAADMDCGNLRSFQPKNLTSDQFLVGLTWLLIKVVGSLLVVGCWVS